MSQWLFLEKNSSLYALIYTSILILYHANVKYDTILDKFEFERFSTKINVTVAVSRKTFSLL